jgi:tetratricopeptide (TPR) repeat protein
MRPLALLLTAAFAASGADPAFELNSKAIAAAEHRNFEEAEGLYREAIAQWAERGAEFDAHRAISESNLAQTLSARGKRREAVAEFESAITLFRRTTGLANDNALTAVNLLAGTYMMLGEIAPATALFQEVLPVERRQFPDSVHLARTLGGLASIRMREPNPDGAMALVEEALALAICSSGEDSLDAGLAYANAAELHRIAGRPERALPLYRKARAIYERALGPNHQRVASILSQEGMILMQDGKLALAAQNMTQAIEILDRGCPECGFEGWFTRANLGRLRLRQGRYDEAGKILAEVLARQEAVAPKPGPEIAVTLQILAQVREKQKRHTDAVQLKEQAGLILGLTGRK